MNDNNDLILPNLQHEEFEMQMRGYSRRQVDEYIARRNAEFRDLEHRLARALDESEHLRREISTVRQQALAGRPAHEEVSERIAQILKLAEDESKSLRHNAEDEIASLRAEAQQESDRIRTDAREQSERILTAAQEQAERTISAARNEADRLRNTARTEADRLATESRKQADATLAEAKSHAKRMLDEATARATAIHDGAERRLNLLSTRHAETVRRLTDILDGVQGLVAAEAARMSLEDEVNQSVSTAIAALEPPRSADGAIEQADSGGQSGDSGGAPAGKRDLSELAPPAPETIATGTPAPPSAGTDNGPLPSDRLLADPVMVHPVTLHQGPVPGIPAAGSAASGSARGPAETPGTADEPDVVDVPDNSGTQGPGDAPGAPGTASGFAGSPPVGRHASPPAMPRRLGVPASESPRNSLPMPGASLPGPAPTGQQPHGANGASARGGGQDGGQTGFIDPDEPTEGVRLMK